MQQPQKIDRGPVLPDPRRQEFVTPEQDTYIVARWLVEATAELVKLIERTLSDPTYTPTQLMAELDSYRFAFREVNTQ